MIVARRQGWDTHFVMWNGHTTFGVSNVLRDFYRETGIREFTVRLDGLGDISTIETMNPVSECCQAPIQEYRNGYGACEKCLGKVKL